MITSKTNQTVKLVNKLKRKKNRDSMGLFIIEGRKFVDDAIKMNMAQTVITTSEHECMYENSLTVSDEVFEYMSETKTPQGVMAIARYELGSMKDIKDSANVVYMDEIQDQGNAGTLVRTAACAGFSHVITSEKTADLFSPKAIRASAGNILKVTVMKDHDYEILKKLKDRGFEVIAADIGGDENAAFRNEGNVLVIGNEGNGISSLAMKNCTKTVRIPMRKDVESLNAAVSGSILMYRINGYL